MNRERIPLLFKDANSDLSLFFATLCVVDIFGVFPIIALPRAIVQCGLYGIPLVLVVFGLQIYTAILLGKSWIIATTLNPRLMRRTRHPLSAVTEMTLGPRVRTLVSILLDITVFGCGIPNLLVASQNLQLFGLKISGQRFDLSFCYWLLVVGVLLCPLMWLGSPRDMKWLSSFSCLAVIVTASLIWWCIITDDRELDVLPVPASPTWDKFVSGYGMLAFQFDVHPTLMTIQVDMRRPQDINKAVGMSFLVSGTLFAVTAGLAVWKYGGSTTENVLQVVPPGLTVCAAILLAALQLCLSSALGHSALFLHLEDKCRVQRSFGWKRCAMRSAIVFLGVAVGESVPRFDIVMALIGGTLSGPLVFLLPPLMYSKALELQARSMQMGSPEVYSATERRRSVGGVPPDPRVHSRSVYYGFLGMTKSEAHRYSYVYYDDSNNAEGSSDYSENEEEQERTTTSDKLPLARRYSDNKPVYVDASEPSRTRRRTNVSIQEPRSDTVTCCSPKTLVHWFGYLVVLFGIAVTISSTYINIKNTIRFVRFTPPCIVNVSVLNIPT